MAVIIPNLRLKKLCTLTKNSPMISKSIFPKAKKKAQVKGEKDTSVRGRLQRDCSLGTGTWKPRKRAAPSLLLVVGSCLFDIRIS